MIIKKYILQNLKILDHYYERSSTSANSLEPTIFSKAALMEYCGWIEESMDEIARKALKNKIKDFDNKKEFEKILGKSHGFDYKKTLLKK